MLEPRQALVVDDNQLNSRLVSVLLKRLGWLATAAESGETALQLLRQRRFDLVLLDMRMPALSGEQVCRTIREEMGLSRLPVYAYTAHSTPDEKERITAAGFDGLLVKPISFADLRDVCLTAGAA